MRTRTARTHAATGIFIEMCLCRLEINICGYPLKNKFKNFLFGHDVHHNLTIGRSRDKNTNQDTKNTDYGKTLEG